MDSHTSVSFKVYLIRSEEDGQNGGEVRRFGLEHDVATNFTYLTEKLKTVFPCLKDAKNFHIYWRDAENDNVKICSDNELIIALTEIQETIKKLYVRADLAHEEPEGADFADGSDPHIVINFEYRHPNVVCDNCEGPVLGFRYKCLQCKDFDLCSKCESKGCHPVHHMLRMIPPAGEKPATCGKSKKGKCDNEKWHTYGDEIHMDLSGWPFTGRHRRHSSKSHRKCPIFTIPRDRIHSTYTFSSDQNTSGTLSPKKNENVKENKASASRTESTNAGPSQENTNTTPVLDLLNKDVQSAVREATRVINLFFDGKIQCPLLQPQSNESSNNTNTNHNQAASTDSNGNQNQSAGVSSDQAENVDPIDVLYQGIRKSVYNKKVSLSGKTSSNGSNSQSAGISTEQTTTTDKPTTSTSSSNKAENVNKPTEVDFAALIQGFQNILSNEFNKKAGNGDKKGETSTGNGTATQAPKAPINKDKIFSPDELNEMLNVDDGIRVRAVVENERPIQQKEAEDGWTLLSDQTERDTATKNGVYTGTIPKVLPDKVAEQNSPSAEPSAPSAEKLEKPDKSDAVASSLRHMLAMGFTNEGNWLSDLLTKHNGDVSAVIEQLIPTKRDSY